MPDDLAGLIADTDAALAACADLRAWDAVRVATLGKSGRLTGLLKELGRATSEERRERGAALNRAKEQLAAAIEARRAVLEAAALDARLRDERIDVTLPPLLPPPGLIHPITRTMEEMAAIFGAMGFAVAEGPDVESDWNNFSALNIPEHHPARADHDTFYLPAAPGSLPAAPDSLPATPDSLPATPDSVATPGNAPPRVLRTHTSPVQVRTMLGQEPPIRVIVPGRTYRADHDATHSPMFHQVEGLVLDRDITLGHLKGCLTDFLRAFFGLSGLPVRFRASYFPFTEPSMEVDIGWNRRTGEIGAGGDWLEILGSGMVHPRVLANCGIDPREWQGFAFGMGIERVTMLKHAIPDLRPFYESDGRWLRHYGFNPLVPASLHEGIGSGGVGA